MGNVVYGVLINTNGSFIKAFDTLNEAREETIKNEYADKNIIICADTYNRCNYCNKILNIDFCYKKNRKNCKKCDDFLSSQGNDGIII